MPRNDSTTAMFNRIAPTYDLLNHLLSFGIDRTWRKRLSQNIPAGTASVLDVATGTGDIAITIARDHPNITKVIGIDIADELLKIAKTKTEKHFPNITFTHANAEALPYPNHSFDAVTIAFGIRNVANRTKALQELKRVLRPEGTLLILEFSMPTGLFMRPMYLFYFRYLLPLVGKLISRDAAAYAYLNASVERFPKPSAFKKELVKNGFSDASITPLTFGAATLYRARS